MDNTGLEGTVALVTGANSGIGAEIARALAARGASVAVHYLDAGPGDPGRYEHTALGADAARQVVRDIERSGGRARAFACDLAEPEAPGRLFGEVSAALGAPGILVNNAAHCELPDGVLEAAAGSIDRHFAVNVRAAMLLSAELARRVRDGNPGSGRIINISTDAARAFPGQVAYGASKAALEAFTRSAAIELGPLGITVNAIAPGPVQTGWMSEPQAEEVARQIPLRRVGAPSDIAGATAFLASPQAQWISGQVIQVAGGHAL